jgi:hypothetical protein
MLSSDDSITTEEDIKKPTNDDILLNFEKKRIVRNKRKKVFLDLKKLNTRGKMRVENLNENHAGPNTDYLLENENFEREQPASDSSIDSSKTLLKILQKFINNKTLLQFYKKKSN